MVLGSLKMCYFVTLLHIVLLVQRHRKGNLVDWGGEPNLFLQELKQI